MKSKQKRRKRIKSVAGFVWFYFSVWNKMPLTFVKNFCRFYKRCLVVLYFIIWFAADPSNLSFTSLAFAQCFNISQSRFFPIVTIFCANSRVNAFQLEIKLARWPKQISLANLNLKHFQIVTYKAILWWIAFWPPICSKKIQTNWNHSNYFPYIKAIRLIRIIDSFVLVYVFDRRQHMSAKEKSRASIK